MIRKMFEDTSNTKLFYVIAFKSTASRDGEYEIYGGIIVCALRSMSQEHGIEMADLAAKYLKVVLAPTQN